MKRLAVIAALILAPSLAASDSWERFELWNACEPISLMVERLDDDAIDIGLTKERIETLVRSRLRAARLYETGISTPFLYVNVLVVAEAYSAAFGLVKEVTDHNSKQMDSGLARTWYLGGIGTHGQASMFDCKGSF